MLWTTARDSGPSAQEGGRAMIRAAVVGGAGYTGIETVRLLMGHPDIDVTIVTSAAEAGRPVEDVYPALSGCGLVFEHPDDCAIASNAELVFLAVPHTAAMALAPALLQAGLTVVDLSADFRLKDPAAYESWYGTAHTAPALLQQAVYGLPELTRDELGGAKLIACAGCYPTASALAAAPALSLGLAAGTMAVIDAKSGVSGAGRTPTAATSFSTANESVLPYKVGTHRHTPEIAQTLTSVAGHPVSVCFAPHLVPMTRGLLASVYLPAASGLTTADAVDAYRSRYSDEPFITVHPAGTMPSTREVSGTNRAHVGVTVDEAAGMLVAVCAIDNLVKGSGGQAIQCANVALGLDERAGLSAFGPVV
jgi:N-acetyl-gamma-glutamyl-phosphate reductase